MRDIQMLSNLPKYSKVMMASHVHESQ